MQDVLVLGIQVTGDLDLNKVTEVELHLAKAMMEEQFVQHQLKPGDPGFEYDKQVRRKRRVGGCLGSRD